MSTQDFVTHGDQDSSYAAEESEMSFTVPTTATDDARDSSLPYPNIPLNAVFLSAVPGGSPHARTPPCSSPVEEKQLADAHDPGYISAPAAAFDSAEFSNEPHLEKDSSEPKPKTSSHGRSPMSPRLSAEVEDIKSTVQKLTSVVAELVLGKCNGNTYDMNEGRQKAQDVTRRIEMMEQELAFQEKKDDKEGKKYKLLLSKCEKLIEERKIIESKNELLKEKDRETEGFKKELDVLKSKVNSLSDKLEVKSANVEVLHDKLHRKAEKMEELLIEQISRSSTQQPAGQHQQPPAQAPPVGHYQQPPAQAPPVGHYQQPPAQAPPVGHYQQPPAQAPPVGHYQQPPAQFPPVGQYQQPPVQFPPVGQYQQPPAQFPPVGQYQQPPVQFPPVGQYQQPPTQFPPVGHYQQPPAQAPPVGHYQQPPTQFPSVGQYQQPPAQFPPVGHYQQPPAQFPPVGQYQQPPVQFPPVGQYQQLAEDGGGANEFITYYRNSHNGKYSTRGLGLIISNGMFSDTLQQRKCAPWDEKHLEETLKALGYRVKLKKNQKAAEMKELFDTIQKNDDPGLKIEKEDDSFVCCIISHGGWDEDKKTDFIYGSDEKRFYLQEVVYEKLNAVECIALRANPKMFFVQSCRGSRVSSIVADGDPKGKSLRLPCDSDFFISYSTALDTKAFRVDPPEGATVATHPIYDSNRFKIGAIYITQLCDALMTYAPALDVSNIVFRVHQNLQASKDGLLPCGGEKTRQCPQLITSLRGPFFFRTEAEKHFKEYIEKCLKTCKKNPLQ